MNLKKVTFGLFLLLIFSLAFMQPRAYSFSGFSIHLTELIFLLTTLTWILALILKKDKIRLGKIYLPLSFFLMAMILSVVFSDNLTKSLIKLLGVFYLIGLAVLAFNLVESIEHAKKVIFFWFAATLISCSISVITLIIFYVDRENPLLLYTLSHYGTLPPGNYPRIQSTFLNPNMFCNYLNVSIMATLAAFRLGWINKAWLWLFVVIFTLAALLTISPGLGGIGLSIGIWLWLVFREQKKNFTGKLFLLLGLSTAFFFVAAILIMPNENPLSPYFIRAPFLTDIFIYPSERLLAWQSAVENFWQNPFFGRGLGLDAVRMESIIASGQKHFINDAHQLWLNLAVQTGITGLAATLYLCVFFIRKIGPFSFGTSPVEVLRLAFGLAFIGAFLYQGLGGSFEDARHLWILIGLLGSFIHPGDYFKVESETC